MLISQEMHDETIRLAHDEHVREMLLEMPPGVDLDNHIFMMSSSREYRRRSGKGTLTIGSVARAMKVLLRGCGNSMCAGCDKCNTRSAWRNDR